MKSFYDDLDGFDLLVETPTPPHHHPKNNNKNLATPGTSSLLPPVLEEEEGQQQHRNDGDDLSFLAPPSTTGKAKAMSFGLSHHRRSSVAIPSKMLAAACVGNPSPLKINLLSSRNTTSTIFSSQQQLQEVPSSPLSILHNNNRNASNHNHGRRSSIAAPRLSQAAGRMLSRLSLGLHDALHWLGGQGSLPQPLMNKEVGSEVQGRGGKRDTSKKRSTTLQQQVGGPSPIAEEEDEEEAGGTTTTPIHAITKELGRKLTIAEQPPPPPGSPEFLTPLEQLLNLCGQDTSLYSIPPMDHLLGVHVDLGAVKKIGEGTYGEAYKAGDVVFKIVPMEGSTLVNGEGQKKAEEILAEAAITLTLNGLRSAESMRSPTTDTTSRLISSSSDEKKQDNSTAGFVETYGVGVCRGRYAQELKKEWHRWDLIHKSDNDPVDIFPPDQLFVVFVVGDGGMDLEHYQPKTFNEIRSILLQTALTLAVAEEACEFEHRDLHWGNILIKKVGSGSDGKDVAKYRLRGVDIEAGMQGAQVTLIDFTLSRLMTLDGEVAYCDLITDPLLFSGPKGDVQAETYRRMKEMTGDCWERHVAGTNAAWLHYLADVCLVHKVEGNSSNAERQALKGFRKRMLGYNSAGEAVWDEFFKGAWTAL